MDWLLATRAWLLGARMQFDPVVRMDYRQHGENLVRTVGPFDDAQIARDTELVLQHYEFVTAGADPQFLPQRLAELQAARNEVTQFCRRVIRSKSALAAYRHARRVLGGRARRAATEDRGQKQEPPDVLHGCPGTVTERARPRTVLRENSDHSFRHPARRCVQQG